MLWHFKNQLLPDFISDKADDDKNFIKDTSYGVGQWLGHGANFTVVDTPGFGDSGIWNVFNKFD